MPSSQPAQPTPPATVDPSSVVARGAIIGADDAERDRPVFAIVANTQAPYRLHFHLRVAREIPEVELHSFFTMWNHPDAAWAPTSPPEINPTVLAAGPSPAGQWASARAEWAKAGRVIRFLRDRQVAAVLVNGYADVGRLRVILWCARRGVRCLVWGDSNIRADNPRRLRGLKRVAKTLFLRWLLRRVTAVLACGSLGRAYFEHYGVPPDRIFYSPVEPDYDLITRLPPAIIDAIRARFGLLPNRRRIIYSGRLAQAKRVDLLIDAFAAVAGRRPGWDVVIVGDGPLRAALAARVPAALRGRFTWVGFVDQQEVVSALYRLSDVLVLPSDFEPWALVINEAAAAGLAMIASDAVGAAAELIREGVNGLTFPLGDLPALTDRLLDVTDPSRIDAMRAASPDVLADWRHRGDPIAGLREAMGVAVGSRQ